MAYPPQPCIIHAAPLLAALLPLLEDWNLAPIVVALQARVALGDEIASALDARMVAVLIGERPGLDQPDSLGIYLTWDPRPRAHRRRSATASQMYGPKESLTDLAARKLHFLMTEARRRKLSGVPLKDEYQLPPDVPRRSVR